MGNPITPDGVSNPDHSFKRPESVLVVVYTTAGDILLVKRTRPIFWQSITGGLKWPDETPRAAAARELSEETGIQMSSDAFHDCQHCEQFEIPPAWTDRYGPNGATNREHQFTLELPDIREVTLNPAEHSASKWLPISQAIAEVWSWTNRQALERLSREKGW